VGSCSLLIWQPGHDGRPGAGDGDGEGGARASDLHRGSGAAAQQIRAERWGEAA